MGNIARSEAGSRAVRFHPRLVTGFLASLVGLFLFLLIAGQVMRGGALTRADLAVYQWLQAHATTPGYGTWSVISSLGSGPALLWIGIGIGLVLGMRKDGRLLTGWAVALLGGGALDFLLKLAYARPRPAAAMTFLENMSFSFPSGHAMGSLIGYGMLAYIVSLEEGVSPAGRRWIIALASALVLAIGLSRLYLGVHYLSDVLAGFIAGGFWLTACITGLEVAGRFRLPPTGQPGRRIGRT